jgi:ABC-type bacteriocin/lantibiotic exporter with double-glycine peptidase domain
VSFCYPGSDIYVLRDVNLHIQPGERIAFAGLNGAAKRP